MSEPRPDFSVVIPTHNRSPILQRCLEALAAQTLPPAAFEAIVCDDGSADDTRAAVEALAGRLPYRLRYLGQPARGANAARNRGCAVAVGRLLLFLNDDTIATPRLLEEHQRSHHAHPADTTAVLGRVTIAPELPPSLFARLHLDASFERWKGQTQLDWRAFYTCNVSLHRALLERHGRFDEAMTYHEDVELAQRLSPHGLQVVYNPAALGYHLHYLVEGDYLGTAARDGRALATWYRKGPHLLPALTQVGFPRDPRGRARLRYLLGDLVVNAWTRPFLVRAARAAAHRHPPVALALYRKVYQSMKREAIRHELTRGT
jgi:glycosyltransferase involved in cell wall biosynthesis